MRKSLCYTPQPLDRKLSKALSDNPQFASWTPEFIATLRGAYDNHLIETNQETIKYDDEEFGHSPLWDLDTGTEDSMTLEQVKTLKSIAAKLIDFRKNAQAKQIERLKAINDNKSSLWSTVSQYYGKDLGIFYQRAATIAQLYIKVIDEFLSKGYRDGIYTRQDAINGTIPLIRKDSKGNDVVATDKSGNKIPVINSSRIFNAVFNRLMQDYSNKMNQVHTEEEYEHIQREFDLIFHPDVWAALLVTTKSMLKHMEGLKVGLMEDVADELNLDNLNDNDFSFLYDSELQTREGWQILTDCLSAYGTLSKEVRKALSSIQKMKVEINPETGEEKLVPVYDDLGYPVMINSIETHQELLGTLRGVRSKAKMMRKLKKDSKYAGLVEMLEKDPALATQFYNEFRKIFQPYMQIEFAWDKIKTIILNRTSSESSIHNYLFKTKYFPSMGVAKTSRFKWNQDDIDRFKKVLGRFKEKDLWEDTKKLNKDITEALKILGIEASNKALSTLFSNMKKKEKLVNTLTKLATYGELENIKSKDNFNKWLTYNAVNPKEKSENQRKVEEIITILVECGNGIKFESKCNTINGQGKKVTYYSDVQPNFLGDLLGTIQSFNSIDSENKEDIAEEKEENRKEFKKWLNDNYLCSSQFQIGPIDANSVTINEDGVDASTIKHYWLRTLWMEANSDILNKRIADYNEKNKAKVPLVKDMFDFDSFTAQFSFMRVVTGSENNQIMPFENFTNRQHYMQMLSSYFAFDTQANGVMSEYAYVPVFILGDSGVCKVLKTVRKGTVDSYRKNGNRFDTSLVVDELLNIFDSEYERMKLFKAFIAENDAKGIENNQNMKDNTDSFTMLTFLNDLSYMRNAIEKETDSRKKKKLETAYNNLIETESTEWNKEDVRVAIDLQLEQLFDNFKRLGESNGALSEENIRKYGLTKIRKAGETNLTVTFNERLKEFYYNTYLTNLLQYQMFTADLGFYGSVKDFQKRYKEIHAPGVTLDTEAIDKWKGDNVLVCPDGMETALYFKDVKVDIEDTDNAFMQVILKTHAIDKEKAIEAIKEGVTDPNKWKGTEEERHNKLKELLGDKIGIYYKFTKNKLKKDKMDTSQTDGQGYRSLEGYRKVMIMNGTWSDRLEALYRKIEETNKRVIKENRDITPDELAVIAEFNNTFMPLKSFMYTMEKYKLNDKTGNHLFIPVQHKYAEAVLIPCLLPKGSKVREMAEYMRGKGIDLIAADTCVKVGMWGQTDIKEDNLTSALAKAVVHKLSYKNYRIQTNVPEHINVERALGTQIRKIIMGNIRMHSSKPYEYLSSLATPKGFKKGEFIITGDETANRTLTGKNLVSLYTSLIVANMMQSFDKFKKTVQDEKELSNLLASAIVNNDKYSLHRLLDIAVNDGEKGPQFNSPLYEGTIEHDVTAMIFSIFRKAVNKQNISGGSLVQVSDWGIGHKEEIGENNKERPLRFVTNKAKDNVLYAEVEIPFKFSFTDSKGEEKALSFNKYCNPDGTFKVGRILEEPIRSDYKTEGEYQDALDQYKADLIEYQSFVQDGKVYIPLIEMDYKGILNVVAYRIPSERDYSMLNCKVVRCIEPTLGGTMRVPAQGTTIAGFDFKQYWSH